MCMNPSGPLFPFQHLCNDYPNISFIHKCPETPTHCGGTQPQQGCKWCKYVDTCTIHDAWIIILSCTRGGVTQFNVVIVSGLTSA